MSLGKGKGKGKGKARVLTREEEQRDKRRWKRWSDVAVEKGLQVSDFAGSYVNAGANKLGAERFWPTSGDMPLEIEKAERILRAFTTEGIAVDEPVQEGSQKKKRVFRKIAPHVMASAKGIVIFTAMRSGFMPFGGAGGGGLVMARLSDGSWSAPSVICPNNASAGLMIGIDVYDVVLILRSEKAVNGFKGNNITIGAEFGVAAGPVGAGASVESGIDKTPIWSYVRSKGFYAGTELLGQLFLDRFDENERFYYWPGLKPKQTLSGKIKPPIEAAQLYRTLYEAETGIAQGQSLEYEAIIPDDVLTNLDLNEDETLRLPPTPEQLDKFEKQGYKDEHDLEFERREREEIMSLPLPPKHPSIVNLMARRQLGLGLSDVKEDEEEENENKEDKQNNADNEKEEFEEMLDNEDILSREERIYQIKEEELNRELEELEMNSDIQNQNQQSIIPPPLPPRRNVLNRPPLPPRAARSSMPVISRSEIMYSPDLESKVMEQAISMPLPPSPTVKTQSQLILPPAYSPPRDDSKLRRSFESSREEFFDA